MAPKATSNSKKEPQKPAGKRKPAAKAVDKTPPKKPVSKPKGAVVSDGPLQKAKYSHKLSETAIQFILDMTVAGYTDEQVVQGVREEFGVSVSERILYYHRNKNAEKLAQSYKDELDTARARTNISCLSRRMVLADELIKKEMKRKRPSLYGIASLLSTADMAIHRAEMRKMRVDEIARRYKEGGDSQREEILSMLERRTALILEAERIETDMLGIVDAEFIIEAPRKLESLKKTVPQIAQAALPPPAGADGTGDDTEGEELDEDALLG